MNESQQFEQHAKVKKDRLTYRRAFTLPRFEHSIVVKTSDFIKASSTNKIFFFFSSMLKLFKNLYIHNNAFSLSSLFLPPSGPKNRPTFMAAT